MSTVTVPAEPTMDMCIAYMRACGWKGKFLRDSIEYQRNNFGSPDECSFVVGLRAAIAVGSGVPLDEIKRGYPQKSALSKRKRKSSSPSGRTVGPTPMRLSESAPSAGETRPRPGAKIRIDGQGGAAPIGQKARPP